MTRPDQAEVLRAAQQSAYTPPGSPILRTPGSPFGEEYENHHNGHGSGGGSSWSGNGNNNNGNGSAAGENGAAVQQREAGAFDYGTSLSIGLMTTVAVTR